MSPIQNIVLPCRPLLTRVLPTALAIVIALFVHVMLPLTAQADQTVRSDPNGYVSKIGLYLAAGDYRRALEVCRQQIDTHPSVAAYVHLSYVYQAIDGYLGHLATHEQWGAVERLYINLAFREPEDLVDPPGGLARMAKEMIQTSVRQQFDIHAAMAVRLDKEQTETLWAQQTAWREAHAEDWWAGVPETWESKGVK